jgi:hypothetical protein
MNNFERRIQMMNWPGSLSIPDPINPSSGKVSTHMMESSDNIAYPTIVEVAPGVLKYLGKDARNYAVQTGEYKAFPTEQEAIRWAENGYKREALPQPKTMEELLQILGRQGLLSD